MYKLHNVIFVVIVLFLTACSSTKDVSQIPPEPPTSSEKFEEAIKATKKYDGLFTVYQDTTNAKTYLAINEDQIGKEYIYFAHIQDGVVAASRFRGQYLGNKVFTIEKYFDRIEFVTQNTSFYFDPENPLSKAQNANISRAIMASVEIKEHDKENGIYLLESDPIFLSEAIQQVKPTPFPGVPSWMFFQLGSLSRDKNKILEIRNYPENTDIITQFTYDNPQPMASGGREVTDERYVTITLQHSFIEMPKNDFHPRFEDPRVGYFTQTVDDMTSKSATPYRDPIHRWNLVKKDPTAELSEPVEPIVWWIENTTPHEFRKAVREGTEAWNIAFEAAGFKNAIVVKEQPDDADWDSGDIRYNVIRWTSSPRPPFAGYGPSFVNPRTGQILGATVMNEFTFFRRNVQDAILFETSGLGMEIEKLSHFNDDGSFCSIGHELQLQLMSGIEMVRALDMSEAEEERLVYEAIMMLMLHEVGHTLGLNHNMKASYFHTLDEVFNREHTEEIGLTGSVMDYSVVNIASDGRETQFYDTKPGLYDIWAIEYGYSTALDDPEAERARLNEILSRSNLPGHDFGNDADDMRSPGKAIDPRVMTWDMSGEPLLYSADRMALVKKTMATLQDRYVQEGQSYQELLNAYLSLSNQQFRAGTVISRFVGGVYVDRSFPEQHSATNPYTPVSLADQKKAMELMSKYIFAPDAFEVPDELYSFLQPQRRGFNFFSSSEDPKIHDRTRNIQMNVMAHIVHPNTTRRMTDSRMYGNQYSVADMMTDLTNAVFQADLNTNVNTIRQNLQISYVERLAMIMDEDSPYDHITRSAALKSLNDIKGMLSRRSRGNAETQAHTQHLQLKIERALAVN